MKPRIRSAIRPVAVGVVIGLCIAVAAPLAVLASGAIDMRAGDRDDVLDWIDHHMFERSMRVPGQPRELRRPEVRIDRGRSRRQGTCTSSAKTASRATA